MQNAGNAFAVSPAGHLGSGACVAALALAAAVADAGGGALAEAIAGVPLGEGVDAEVAAIVPLASSLLQATTARRKTETVAICMRPRIRDPGAQSLREEPEPRGAEQVGGRELVEVDRSLPRAAL